MRINRSLRGVLARAPNPEPDPPEPPAVPAPLPRAAGFLLDDASIVALIDAAEAALAHTAPADMPALFAPVPLDVFALLAAHRPARWPRIAAWLPEMPGEDVQLAMTGAVGETVMLEAAGFLRRLLPACAEHLPQPLHEANILDYGIGWARVARLFYKYVPVDQLHGVDAWPASLGMADLAGFKGRLSLIDAVPTALPFRVPFDLVYAFSVFTHLSERTARAATRAIRAGMADNGLLALTIRPAEFWRLSDAGDAEVRLAEHYSRGFAFRPADLPATDGDVPYGDTSMTLDYIRRAWPEFRVVGLEVNGADPYQSIVMLKPA